MTLGNSLVFYYLWIGDLPKAAVLINTLRQASRLSGHDPLTRQMWLVMEAMHSWFMADQKTCLAAVTAGAVLAESSGVHLLDLFQTAQGVYGSLTLGDPAHAKELLRTMAGLNTSRLMDGSLYQYLAASEAWYAGDLQRAAEHGEVALKLADATGSPVPIALCQLELAMTLFDLGRHKEAALLLEKAGETSRGMKHLEFLCILQGARFALEQGKRRKQG